MIFSRLISVTSFLQPDHQGVNYELFNGIFPVLYQLEFPDFCR